MRVATAACRFVLTGCAAVAAIGLSASAQEQRSQTFRSSVDLVSVDVSVVGDGGKPVTGLTPGDFVLSVDGRPRRVTSAEFISATAESKPTPNGGAAPTPAPALYSTNADTNGRLILFMVDLGTINRGRARPVMESISRFVSRLSSSDRIGLVAFPGSATQIDFTRNHELIQAALPRLVGEADTFDTVHRIGVAEAMDVNRGDRVALTRVIDRECAQLAGADAEQCRTRVQFDAIGIASLIQERSQNTMAALRAVADRLAAIDAPKTVVFVSEGLVLEGMGDLTWLAPAAGRSQLTFQVLHLDSPAADASNARESPTPGRDRSLGQDGLDILAGTTRGGVFRVAGNADIAMNRLGLELSGHYLLGFEPEAGDRDGKPHKIKVELPGRSGIEIRARGEFAVDAAPRTSEAALGEMLRTPTIASGIGLKLGTFTLKDASIGQLRLLMVVEIDRAANPEGTIALAYAMTDGAGKIVSSQIDRAIKTPVHPESRTQVYTGFIPTDAKGVHTLKVAVVDSRGKRGSVEHRFTPALTVAGQVEAADLLLADSREGGGAAIPALASAFTSGMVNSYVELYGSADVLKSTMVMFEVAESEQGRALDGAVGKARPDTADQPGLRAIESALPTALLPPGEYVLRAIITAGGKRVGQIARPFRVGQIVVAAKAANAVGLQAVEPADDGAAVPNGIGQVRPLLRPQAGGRQLLRRSVECRRARREQSGAGRRSGQGGTLLRRSGVACEPDRYSPGRVPRRAVAVRERRARARGGEVSRNPALRLRVLPGGVLPRLVLRRRRPRRSCGRRLAAVARHRARGAVHLHAHRRRAAAAGRRQRCAERAERRRETLAGR